MHNNLKTIFDNPVILTTNHSSNIHLPGNEDQNRCRGDAVQKKQRFRPYDYFPNSLALSKFTRKIRPGLS